MKTVPPLVFRLLFRIFFRRRNRCGRAGLSGQKAQSCCCPSISFGRAFKVGVVSLFGRSKWRHLSCRTSDLPASRFLHIFLQETFRPVDACQGDFAAGVFSSTVFSWPKTSLDVKGNVVPTSISFPRILVGC